MSDPYWPRRRIGGADNVWYGLCKATSEEVVLKLFEREHFSDTEAPRDAAVLTEVQILKDLSKQYPARVIQFRNFYANDEDQLVLVMEAAETTLQEVLDLKGRLTEDDAREAIFGMLEAVFCVHQAQLVHRDIKPANLMLMDRNDFSSLKIADFGVTVGNVGYDSLNQIAGTMGYEAPEMLAHSFYGKAVDLWSCGVTAYQLLYGHVPFKPTASTGLFATKKIGPKQQLDAIKRGYDLSSGGVVVSDEGKHLIRGLLEIDPARRFTAEQALRHPWFGHEDNSAESPAAASKGDFQVGRKLKTRSGKTVEAIPEHPPWMIVTQQDGTVYFFNKDTKATSWTPPFLPASGPPPALPARGDNDSAKNQERTPRASTENEESDAWVPSDTDVPVPGYPDWYPVQDDSDATYFYNIKTKKSVWTHPSHMPASKGGGDAPISQPKTDRKKVKFGQVVEEMTARGGEESDEPVAAAADGSDTRDQLWRNAAKMVGSATSPPIAPRPSGSTIPVRLSSDTPPELPPLTFSEPVAASLAPAAETPTATSVNHAVRSFQLPSNHTNHDKLKQRSTAPISSRSTSPSTSTFSHRRTASATSHSAHAPKDYRRTTSPALPSKTSTTTEHHLSPHKIQPRSSSFENDPRLYRPATPPKDSLKTELQNTFQSVLKISKAFKDNSGAGASGGVAKDKVMKGVKALKSKFETGR